MVDSSLRIVGVVASPDPGARTSAAVSGVLAGAESQGARTELLELSREDPDRVIARIADASGVVFGSPVYRASYSAMLKSLLERTERGRHGETTAPLRGTATAIVMTGASEHHFLAVDGLRAVLATFFAAQVLSPAFYVDHTGYRDRSTLNDDMAELAARHGAALADLAAAVSVSPALAGLEPLV